MGRRDGVVEVRVPAESAHLYERAGLPPRRVDDWPDEDEPQRAGHDPDEAKRARAVALRKDGGLSFRAVGDELGVSGERARQLLLTSSEPGRGWAPRPPGARGGARGPSKGDAEQRQLAEARRKAAAAEALTRDERHLLQREYRRREREGAA